MRVIVFGHKGMLGRELVDVFNANEVDVVAPDVDITNYAAVLETLVDYRRPHTIAFNAAALADVDACARDTARAYMVNALGAMNVASAAERQGAQLFHFSTDAVFDGSAAFGEVDAPAPVNAYGQSKLLGEQFVRVNCHRATIVRLCTMYGANGKNYASGLWRKMRTRETVSPDRGRTVAPTDARWIAEVCYWLAIRHVRLSLLPPLLHLAPADTCTWGDVVDRMTKKLDCPPNATPFIATDAYGSARARVSALRCDVADAIGIERPTWSMMLDAYMDRNAEASP